jgi:hypothetical protein
MAYLLLYPQRTLFSSIIPTARRTVEGRLAEAAAPQQEVDHSYYRY